jgi:hypothetical protein
MKNNPMTGMLLGLVFLSTLASTVLIVQYNYSIHKIQSIQGQPELAAAGGAQNVVQALLNETIEYAKATKNPDIIRIVQGATGGKALPTAAKPTK